VIENYDIEKTILLFDISDIDLQGYTNIFIVLGHEINGVTQPIIEIADHIVKIPMYGMKNSLNVATCAGIIGYFLKSRIIR
jgi:TrmH family RNA methyltransferase